METSVLTIKGQLLIPKRIRNRYGIAPGVKIIFEETDKGVLLMPMNGQYFKSFAGILKGGNLKEDMKKMKEEEKRL
jgi:AbrB family looped-hinge helix DNA binding protein